jgi:hypothetical protein
MEMLRQRAPIQSFTDSRKTQSTEISLGALMKTQTKIDKGPSYGKE